MKQHTPGTLVTWNDFDDADTADALRAVGIKNTSLTQVTTLQKMMAYALRDSYPQSEATNGVLIRQVKQQIGASIWVDVSDDEYQRCTTKKRLVYLASGSAA
jgi:hypothetical protein